MTLPQAEQVCRQAKGYRAAAFKFCLTHGLPITRVGNFGKTERVELKNEWSVNVSGRKASGCTLIEYPSKLLKYMWIAWRDDKQLYSQYL